MGSKQFKGNYTIPSENDIAKLENNIKNFCDQNQIKIRSIFESEFYTTENIVFSILDNDQINKESKDDPFAEIKDYVISWSIPGKMNPTKCCLTFFNLGSFFGSNGFLYSICLFYSYLLKIGRKYTTKEEIERQINACLDAINDNDKNILNEILETNISDEDLKILRKGKDYLINITCISEEELKIELKNDIERNFTIKKSFKSKMKNIGYYLYYLYLFLINIFSREYRINKNNYLNFKKNINRKSLFKKIYNILFNDFSFFEDYNLFIIATDDNVELENNYFATFMGYYCPGLGINRRARRLKFHIRDGFDNDINLNKFYYEIIYEIRNFFKNNQEQINYINKTINIDFNIEELSDNDQDHNELKANYKKYSEKISVNENNDQLLSSNDTSFLIDEPDIRNSLIN